MSFRAIDFYRGTKIVDLYKYYTNLVNNDIASSDLYEVQKNRLINLLINLKSNEYYSNFLANVRKSDIEVSPYEVLNLFPLTDKSTITENFESIKNLNFKYERAYTGGSTGSPFHYLIDKKTISETRAFSYALWNKYLNYKLGERVIVIAGSSLGKSDSIKKRVYNKLQNKHFVSNFNRGIDEAKLLVKYINISNSKCFLYAYPSNLVHLTKIIKEQNLSVKTNFVAGIICTSEMLFDSQKQFLEDFFNVKVLNMYGANDGGIAGGSINNLSFIYNGLDCIAENTLINGQNEIVLTSLSSYAFPIVRYRVGDIGEVSFVTEGYPFVIKNLKGRTRDLIHINKNQCIHGSEFNKIFKEYPFVVEYQIEQFSDYTCVIRLGSNDSIVMHQKLNEISAKIKFLLGNTPFQIENVKNLNQINNEKLKNIISHVS